MRRKDREITDFKTILGIIDECDIIRLGLSDGEYPYIVPVNFAYKCEDDELSFYIHGALAGRKFELMQKNGKCSFEMDIPLKMECIPDKKDITMRYKCVMGMADIVFLDGEEKRKAVEEIILARYDETRDFEYNKSALPRTMAAKLKVTDITAKVNPLSGGAD